MRVTWGDAGLSLNSCGEDGVYSGKYCYDYLTERIEERRRVSS